MNDIKEKLLKIYGGLSERLKSPFIITFLLVWVIQNWILVYKVFNFDSNYTLEMKTHEIKIYLDSKTKGDLFWWPLLYAMLSFLGYLFVNLIYEGIYTFYTKWGRTTIYYIIDKNKNVARNEYTKKISELERLNTKYNTLDEHSASLQEELDSVNQNLKAAQSQINHLTETLENLNQKGKTNDEKAKSFDRWVHTQNDFLLSSTRVALFHLFDFHYTGVKNPSDEIKITELFFGAWSRGIYLNTNLGKAEHESYVYFDDILIKDYSQKFFAKIKSLQKINKYEIYRMVYLDKENNEQVEILAKLSDIVVVGALLSDSRESYTKIIQYKAVT